MYAPRRTGPILQLVPNYRHGHVCFVSKTGVHRDRTNEEWQAECTQVLTRHRVDELYESADAADAETDAVAKAIWETPARGLVGIRVKLELYAIGMCGSPETWDSDDRNVYSALQDLRRITDSVPETQGLDADDPALARTTA